MITESNTSSNNLFLFQIVALDGTTYNVAAKSLPLAFHVLADGLGYSARVTIHDMYRMFPTARVIGRRFARPGVIAIGQIFGGAL